MIHGLTFIGDNITGQLNFVRPDDIINAPGGGYINDTNSQEVLSVGDEIYKVKNIITQYCTIDAWND